MRDCYPEPYCYFACGILYLRSMDSSNTFPLALGSSQFPCLQGHSLSGQQIDCLLKSAWVLLWGLAQQVLLAGLQDCPDHGC